MIIFMAPGQLCLLMQFHSSIGFYFQELSSLGRVSPASASSRCFWRRTDLQRSRFFVSQFSNYFPSSQFSRLEDTLAIVMMNEHRPDIEKANVQIVTVKTNNTQAVVGSDNNKCALKKKKCITLV